MSLSGVTEKHSGDCQEIADAAAIPESRRTKLAMLSEWEEWHNPHPGQSVQHSCQSMSSRTSSNVFSCLVT